MMSLLKHPSLLIRRQNREILLRFLTLVNVTVHILREYRRRVPNSIFIPFNRVTADEYLADDPVYQRTRAQERCNKQSGVVQRFLRGVFALFAR